MDEKEDDDIVIVESADADINVNVYGSAEELENLLKKGTTNDILLHLEWREDTLIVIRYPCSENPGMSPVSVHYQFVRFPLSPSQQETLL